MNNMTQKEKIAQDLKGADMFKVEPAVPYAADYKICIEEAKQRIGNAERC